MNSPNLEQSISKAVAELTEKYRWLDLTFRTGEEVGSDLEKLQALLSSKLREIAQEAIAAVRVEEKLDFLFFFAIAGMLIFVGALGLFAANNVMGMCK